MKRFNQKLYALYMQDQKMVEGLPLFNQKGWHPMYEFLPLTLKHVNSINKEYKKVGIFSKNDLIQAGNKGLVAAWSNIDWALVMENENPDKRLVNFLSARITGAIKRELNQAAVIVAIPESYIRKTKSELAVDALFGNWLYSFRIDDYAPGTTLRYVDILDDRSEEEWIDIYELNDKLTDIMLPLRQQERDIIRMVYGIDYQRPMSYKEISDKLNISAGNARKIKERALKKLNTEENRKLLETFLQ